MTLDDLSCRARTILRRLEITSIEQLAKTPWADLIAARGCGAKTISEYRTLLADNGFLDWPDHSPKERSSKERVEPALLRAEQAAAYLNISVRNLWRLSAHGHLTPVYLGRSVRFSVRDIDRFIEQGGTPAVTT